FLRATDNCLCVRGGRFDYYPTQVEGFCTHFGRFEYNALPACSPTLEPCPMNYEVQSRSVPSRGVMPRAVQHCSGPVTRRTALKLGALGLGGLGLGDIFRLQASAATGA